MKKIAFALVMGTFVGSAMADVYTNGPVITDLGAGAGGGDVSRLNGDARATTFGLAAGRNAAGPGPYWMCENFSTGANAGGYLLQNVTTLAYISNSTAAISGYLKVYSSDPSAGGTLIYGDFTNARGTSSAWRPNGVNVYRVSNESNLQNTSRQLQAVSMNLGAGVGLAANSTYFLVWTYSAASSTSIFSPMVTKDYSSGAGNAKVYWTGGSPQWRDALANAADASSGVELPYSATYAAVPEPGSIIAIGAGLAALVARRRRKA